MHACAAAVLAPLLEAVMHRHIWKSLPLAEVPLSLNLVTCDPKGLLSIVENREGNNTRMQCTVCGHILISTAYG